MDLIKKLFYDLWVLFVATVQVVFLIAWIGFGIALVNGARHLHGHEIAVAGLGGFFLMLTAWFNMWHFFHRLKRVDREAYAVALKGEWFPVHAGWQFGAYHLHQRVASIAEGGQNGYPPVFMAYARFTRYLDMLAIIGFCASFAFAGIWGHFHPGVH